MSFPAASLPDSRQHTHPAAAAILIAAAVIAPPLAVFAPLGLAPLLALAALALVAADWRACRAGAARLTTLAALIALIAAWGALSALWSLIPLHSLFESGRLLVIGAAGLAVLGAALSLTPAEAERLGYAVIAGAVLALLLLQLERHDGEALTHLLAGIPDAATVPLARYDRGVTLLLLAAWPAAAALAARLGAWAALLAAALVAATLVVFASTTAALAGLLGAIAWPLGWRLPRLVAATLVATLLALALVLPLAAPDAPAIVRLHQAFPALKPSALHRLAIWNFTAGRIAERPLLGWGMDASRALPGGKERVADAMPELGLPAAAELLPLHPHDAALQWRVELGLPGAVLAVALLGSILWRIATDRGLPPSPRAFCLAYATSAITVALLSFGAWQAWWLSSLWLTAASLAAIAAMPGRGGTGSS